MPPVVTVGAYCEPKLHTLLVKKLQPLYLIAGIACTTRVMNTNPSISSGTTAPTRPSHLISEPLRTQPRSAPPSRRGGGGRAPPARTGGSEGGVELAPRSGGPGAG